MQLSELWQSLKGWDTSFVCQGLGDAAHGHCHGWSWVCKIDMKSCQGGNGWLLLLHTSKMLPPVKTHPGSFLVRFCCDMQNTVVCTQIAAARSLWTAPGQVFLLRKVKKLSLFSHSLYSELLCYLSRSWLHPNKLNSKSEEIWSSSPTS